MSFLKPRSMETNRDRLMSVAEMAILEKGFAATSIEEIVAEVGITKGGFFYHFPDKSALVRAILERHVEVEEGWFEDLFARARSDDPLQEFLGFLDILREEMERLPDVHPGCLIAACCFQERLFERDIHDIAAGNLLRWRERFHDRFRLIAGRYPPRIDVDLEALADMLTALTDGAIILSKTVRRKEALPRQIGLYRQFVTAIFLGTP
ncbi:TetR family transcriptional regulator [Zhengella mangrovi]|uniref:TetR family transcriptional regulator n=1 Tax=Zhengella mangrovi TaxID=1982044 RepID=A0A2G1QUE2_9HYPH|nr:TetR/AcrR family transcriptional regulator [Zhengella mangrovi]PHP69167.1 TetR family transcriptional regulator [Zhengella mangrovi]